SGGGSGVILGIRVAAVTRRESAGSARLESRTRIAVGRAAGGRESAVRDSTGACPPGPPDHRAARGTGQTGARTARRGALRVASAGRSGAVAARIRRRRG